MAIIWKGCAPGNFRPGRRGGYQPEAIVIHVMDGTIGAADSWFNDPQSQVSAHYGVGKNGDIHQYVKETDTAFHAGTVVNPTWPRLKPGVNPNYYTIGIEHEGRGDDPWPWPAPLLNASIALVSEIAGRWNIALNNDNIVMHHQIRANKTCPGVHFDMPDYMGRLTGTGPAAAPSPPINIFANPLQLHILVNANLRRFPGTSGAIIEVLASGGTFDATGMTVAGEQVRGNARWYQNADGAFVWAGLTDRPNGPA